MKRQFRFSAKDWHGQTIRDFITAANKEEASELLRSRNLVLLTLKEQSTLQMTLKKRALNILHSLGYRPYSSRDLMIFCRQFATMFKAGINMVQCLKILSNQKEMAALQKMAGAAAAEVERGASLSAALKNRPGQLPALMINMIEAGEASGKLDAVMEKMADHFEKEHDFSEKIRSATFYPAFIVAVSVIVMVIMVLFVLPQFAAIFETMGMEMPFLTRFLLAMATAISSHKLYLAFILTLVLTGAMIFARTAKGRRLIDRLRLGLPFFGMLYRQAVTARFARTLAILLASGISLHQALQMSGKVIDNTIIKETLSRLGEALNRGEALAGPMQKEPCFSSLLTEMVRVGEETGALEQTLNSTARFYEKETAYVVDRLGTILEPALLLIIGFFIGLLVLSILSPMYRIFEMI